MRKFYYNTINANKLYILFKVYSLNYILHKTDHCYYQKGLYRCHSGLVWSVSQYRIVILFTGSLCYIKDIIESY